MVKWLKRILLGLGGLILLGLGLFLWLAPAYVDDAFNSPLDHAPYAVSAEAAEVFDSLPGVADLHADALLWKRDLSRENRRGQLDIPRLASGKVGLQVFGVVTKSPRGQNYEANSADTDNITLLSMAQLWPPRTWFSLKERALYQSQKLQRFADGSGGALVFVRGRQALDTVVAPRAARQSVTAGFLGLEGAHALEGELANLDALYEAGFRMFGLAHFFDNAVAGSVHGLEKYGLTELGRQVVQRAQALGIILDLAHASHAAIADTLALASQPLVFSHGGVKGVCNTNRNLTDDEIRGIAETGGLIGLGAWDAAACGTTPAGLAKAMAYVKALVGPEHVALGTDFDGAVKSSYGVTEYDAVVDALLKEGFSAAEVEAAMIGNALRVFNAVLPD